MRDPRLAELEFLLAVQKASPDGLRVLVPAGGGGEQFGLPSWAYRNMVIEVAVSGHLGGDLFREPGGTSPEELRVDVRRLIGDITAGRAVDVSITHAGSVHLYDLRDRLMRDRDRDPIGSWNKSAWNRDLELRLRFATVDSPLSVVFADLDDFGQVNKADWGSQVLGDRVLELTFRLLMNAVGGVGEVYRVGGEEIGILMPDVDLDRATKIAQHLCALIADSVAKELVGALPRPQTMSVGVTSFSGFVDAELAMDFVNRLEKEAKKAGKNRVVARAFSP